MILQVNAFKYMPDLKWHVRIIFLVHLYSKRSSIYTRHFRLSNHVIIARLKMMYIIMSIFLFRVEYIKWIMCVCMCINRRLCAWLNFECCIRLWVMFKIYSFFLKEREMFVFLTASYVWMIQLEHVHIELDMLLYSLLKKQHDRWTCQASVRLESI